jgi:hypothetical protein
VRAESNPVDGVAQTLTFKFAADTLSKPEKYISVTVNHDEALSFAGTFDPAFLMVVVRCFPEIVLK